MTRVNTALRHLRPVAECDPRGKPTRTHEYVRACGAENDFARVLSAAVVLLEVGALPNPPERKRTWKH
jgi:hypothetical protein